MQLLNDYTTITFVNYSSKFRLENKRSSKKTELNWYRNYFPTKKGLSSVLEIRFG